MVRVVTDKYTAAKVGDLEALWGAIRADEGGLEGPGHIVRILSSSARRVSKRQIRIPTVTPPPPHTGAFFRGLGLLVRLV